ncbi:molybdopterin-guanine dinucleotide biosynthesis protein B [Helicobacter apodemus]|uniref:Molybdopterin-guanine dinucleotide biosynthesis protein B n=1 Tax=Helicobacter apodemus TaxID=135569 RepID=A0A099UDN8_9HELI|nr:molybdopterin-guanine dinucleotide biosynthesis protein B [Helicobacter apodemus]AWI33859.1 molybdopterin-guanine dinucleotide biosynthesis protein MobB [Helicobacter apodemus]MDE6958379.1 molybdopterin-guanine dinucleotide biosynthesis protein B [Helicobacter apodemus]TLE14834.1 molybdopterin-guanine dinucleotide biosynthesis protein B [Helicobacter apodemus]
MRIVVFSGNSNSGKTTLIEKLSLALQPNKKISIIKHDPKDKAIFDTKGKDSYRFYESGANIAILSPTQTTLRFHTSLNITEIIKYFKDCDYLFIEGLKELPFPKITIARENLDERFFAFSNALAIDNSIKDYSKIPKNIDILNLNNTQEILHWINTHIKDTL